MTTTTDTTNAVEAHLYDGEGFDLDILRGGERVRLAGQLDNTVEIETPHGVVLVRPGWWLIRDVAGEIRAFAPGDFAAMSEIVSDLALTKAERFAYEAVDRSNRHVEDLLRLAGEMAMFIAETASEADVENSQRFSARFAALRDGA